MIISVQPWSRPLLADDAETFFIGLSKFARLAVHQPDIGAVFSVVIDRKAKDPVAKLRVHLDATRIRKTRTLISATSPGRVTPTRTIKPQQLFGCRS